MSEATATAERTEEQVQAEVSESQVVPETQSDAGQSQDTGTAESGGDQSTQSEVKTFESGDDYAAAMEAEDGKGKASDAPKPRRPLVDPTEATRRVEGVKTRHGERQAKFDAYKAELMAEGMSEALATRIVNEAKGLLNEHHSDLLENAGWAKSEETRATYNGVLTSTVEAMVPEGLLAEFRQADQEALDAAQKAGETYTWIDRAKLAAEVAGEARYRDGLREGRKQGFEDGRKQREGVASGASSGQEVQGSAPIIGNEDELLWNPTTPIDTVNQILARKNGQ